MANFLTERLTFDQAGLKLELAEAVDTVTGIRPLFMNGIFVQGGVKNLNERVYPVLEIRRAVESVTEILQRGESVL
jgi:hypothetical protein